MSRLSGFMLLVLLCLSSAGCLNTSTLQTARALQVGEHRVLVGGGMAGGTMVAGELGPDASDSGMWDGLLFPYAEIGFRLGAVENLELGAHWALLGGVGVDGKYQFLDREGFAAAVGLGVNYRLINTKDVDFYTSATHFDVQVPVYLSYDFSKNFSLYGAPRYLFSVGSTHNTDPDSGSNRLTELLHLLGSSAGFRLGDSWGLFGEFSAMAVLNKQGTYFVQGNGSVYFDF